MGGKSDEGMAERKQDLNGKGNHANRRYILSFVGMLCSLMVLLSIISYSTSDQALGDMSLLDLWRAFVYDPAMSESAARTSNLLGILGALTANWLINSTVGYSAIVFPLLGMGWAWVFFRKAEKRNLFIATNYILGYSLLIAMFAGAVRTTESGASLTGEWSGVVGTFLAQGLVKIVGFTGTILILLTVFFFMTVAVTRFDLSRLAQIDEWFKTAALKFSLLFNKFSVRAGSRKADDSPNMEHVGQSRAKREVEIRRPDGEPEHGSGKRAPEGQKNEPIRTFGDDEVNDLPLEIPADAAHGETPEKAIEMLEDELDVQIQKRIAPDEPEDTSSLLRETADEEIDYSPPSIDLLEPARSSETVDDEELKANADLLRAKLADFDVEIESVSVTPGPVVTLYELIPAAGVKISRIQNLEDDIALALKAKGIRIIAPIPGKGTVGVEIPNHKPALVTLRSALNSAKFRDSDAALPLAFGKTISGEVFVDDLAKMPHLLIAGATGSGKSVGINTIICSLLFSRHPSDVKFVIIDPKKIELAYYRKLKNHFLAISPDIGDEAIITTPANAVMILKSAEIEMERRYERLAHAGVRNIQDYNERVSTGRLRDTDVIKHRKIPYLLIIIDELADLMITAAREVEEPIARLAQLARAVGIHLVLATQRPSVDVLTGVIKANFPARIAYQVSSKIDSRTILDMNGADQLLGAGDMLYLPAGSPKPLRIQNAFISSDEVERVNDHIGKQKGYSQPYMLPSVFEKKKGAASGAGVSEDELFEEAARIIVRHQQGSVSLLQRRLKVGYSRAARLVDELEAAGIVGPFDGSKAREVLVESEAELEAILKNLQR